MVTSRQRDQPTDIARAEPSHRARVWTLTIACLGVSLVISSMVALNTVLAEIAVETSATQTQLTWIVDSYTLTLACLLLPAGAIGDRYGRRGALIVGLALFAASSFVPTIWSDPTTVILSRAAAGIGAAFVMPATLSLLTSAYPADERSKAVGIWAGVAGSGAIVGMLGSGVLLRFWSWPSIFWVFALAATLLIPLSLTIPTSKDPERKPVDWLGATVIGAAVATFVFGILEAPARGWDDPLVYGFLTAGAALSLLFAAVELRQRHPLLDVRLFRDPVFTTGTSAITVFFLAMFGFLFLSMQFIQLVLGYDALETAFALGPMVGPMLLLSVSASWFLPKMGLRLVVFVGLLLIAAGLISMRTLDVDASYWDLLWPLLLTSIGTGLCTAPTTSAIMTSVPDDKQGVASAVNDTTREIGAALGIALTGSILASSYTSTLAPHLSGYPESVRAAATRSLGEALALTDRLGPQGVALAELSRTAFLRAMEASVLALGIVVAASSVLIALWAPGRDGQQLAIVRRVRRR